MTCLTFEKHKWMHVREIYSFIFQFGNFCFIEKGKLKHATVSPEPGETKDIRSYKVSHLFSLTLYFI